MNIDDRDKTIAGQVQQIKNLEKKIEELERQLAEKQGEIRQLKMCFEYATNRIVGLVHDGYRLAGARI